jgi:hypothetical protein
MDWFDLIRFVLVLMARYQVWRRASSLASACWAYASERIGVLERRCAQPRRIRADETMMTGSPPGVANLQETK